MLLALPAAPPTTGASVVAGRRRHRVSWAGAGRSRPRRCAGSRATAACPGSSPTRRPCRSTSDARLARSPSANGPRWWSAIAVVRSRAAPGPRNGASPTTSSTGPTVDRPTWTIWSCSVDSTTAASTIMAGISAWPPTVTPNSYRQPGSTRIDHDAEIPDPDTTSKIGLALNDPCLYWSDGWLLQDLARAFSPALIPWRARSRRPGDQAGCLVGASPGQGDAGAAMTVVVDARRTRRQCLSLQPYLGTARTQAYPVTEHLRAGQPRFQRDAATQDVTRRRRIRTHVVDALVRRSTQDAVGRTRDHVGDAFRIGLVQQDLLEPRILDADHLSPDGRHRGVVRELPRPHPTAVDDRRSVSRRTVEGRQRSALEPTTP